ncbi:CHAT domain-containing protein [Streptomyces sp. NBC_00287]|uniref:CHAT domain-containing protein n=1 Tax=Streptomyces sp. NBC_00287 TaxID=2975702 RepID=UPI002E2B345B|nr:CHAT domain-containing protein [Streptomyces sp. NBC_00287]
MTGPGVGETLIEFLVTRSTDYETLLSNLDRLGETVRPYLLATLREQAGAAAGAGRPAEAELLEFLARQASKRWQIKVNDQGRPDFAALVDRAVRLDLLDAFLVFRAQPDVLPDDPVPVAQKLLGHYKGLTMHQRSAVLAALAMAAPDSPMSAVRARTWWAFSLMERARGEERMGRADVDRMRDRRHALFHAGRAVVALHGSGRVGEHPEAAYWAYSMLAQAHRSLGDLRQGLKVLLDCQRELRHLDDDGQRWLEFDRIVAIEMSAQGHHRGALHYFDRALDGLRDLSGDRPHPLQLDLLIERGKTHLHHGTLNAASADFQQAAETAEALGQIPTVLRARALRASALQTRGRNREALRVFQENLATALRGGILMSHTFRCALAQQLCFMGYLDEAEEQYLEALAELRQDSSTRSVNEVGCLAGLGRVAEDRGDHDQAMAWYEESNRTSLAYRRTIDGTVLLANALERRFARDSSRATAQELLPRVTELHREARERGSSVGEFVTGRALIVCLTRLDRWAEAAELSRRLIAEADERTADIGHGVGEATDDDSVKERMAFVKIFADRPELLGERFALLQWCRDVALRRIVRTPWPVLRAESGGRALTEYEGLLDLLHGHGDQLPPPDDRSVPEWCFDLHEEVKARDLLADLALGPLPEPPSVPQRLIADERRHLAALRRDLTRSALGALGPASEEAAEQLTSQLSAVHTAIGEHAPEYTRLRQGAPARLNEVRTLLTRHAPPEGMLLASYFCGNGATYCFVLTSDGEPLRMRRIPLGRDRIEALSRRLRTVFNGGRDPDSGVLLRPLPARRPDKRDTSFLTELTPLLEPFADLLAERQLVAVSAHGPLSGVPFGALPLPSGTLLGESNAVVSVPGVSSLRYLLAHPVTPPRAAVAVGCAGREDDTGLFEEDDALLGEGPWRSVSRVAGLAATPAAVRTALGQADLAHVTCHGFTDTDDPLEAALLFSDGRERPSRNWEPHNVPAHARYLLRVRDVTVADAAPQRLVLRACSAGWGEADHPGADLTGLTWAFLRSGSRSVIAPRWDVNQQSSRELLAAYYRRLGRGEPAWRALWEAQRELAGDPSRPWLGHVFHWGAFTLTGDWR